ncbi:2-methoxy-6-polyprenyl-1,4-benzoquinol methylase [subsurface metagenome]
MSRYSQERMVQIFDDVAEKKAKTPNEIIPQITGQIAFERLGLEANDVLLDIGTGTGDKAIRATHICYQVVGIDISRKSLEIAFKKALEEKLDNLVFAYGSFEEPCRELDLAQYKISKILAVYSLHHLPDQLKKKALGTLTELLHRPGRIVIGDLMFFEDPDKYHHQFDEVGYDDGDTDFPSGVEYLRNCLSDLDAKVRVEKIHPLVGVIVADWSH